MQLEINSQVVYLEYLS